jgi:hypothetical protein
MFLRRQTGLLRLVLRHSRQILSHHINDNGSQHQKHGDPKIPVMMQAFPVLATTMPSLSILLSVVLIVRHLIHEISAFCIPSRLIRADWRRRDPSISPFSREFSAGLTVLIEVWIITWIDVSRGISARLYTMNGL